MYFDLNVSVPVPASLGAVSQSKKGKGKQMTSSATDASYSPAQIASMEARVDLLVHCASQNWQDIS